ncbi:pentapeptide repeat-containing protein [Paenibacillus fonticola]|uniref:pentapeptide repeat-containing protein n=1 Tax=Paenibacillus fonticola TaxID=379896 RepID=UPI00035CAF83|nr:pentapeptide repeat-containing protein [Paenibacillus fonticola]
MDKQEALSHFYKEYFIPGLAESIEDVETKFNQYRTELALHVENSFREICLLVNTMQSKQEKDPIAYIHYSLMRTSVLEESYLYRVEAYSNKWYLDEQACMSVYDASWAYQSISMMKEKLVVEQRKYMGLLNPADIENMIQSALKYFHQFIVSLIKSVVSQLVQLQEYQSIQKSDRLYIRSGEYKDISETLYIDDIRTHDESKFKLALIDEQDILIYENFRGNKLLSIDVIAKDLRYSDFSYSDFKRSKFVDCVLIGTCWRESDLREADFDGSWLTDADFSGSDLRGAYFGTASGQAIRDGAARSPGLLGINFSEANLNAANLAHVRCFENVQFKGASMQGTAISLQQKGKMNLSDSQINSIDWIE